MKKRVTFNISFGGVTSSVASLSSSPTYRPSMLEKSQESIVSCSNEDVWKVFFHEKKMDSVKYSKALTLAEKVFPDLTENIEDAKDGLAAYLDLLGRFRKEDSPENKSLLQSQFKACVEQKRELTSQMALSIVSTGVKNFHVAITDSVA